MRSINRGMAKLFQISWRYRGPIIHRCITMFGSSLASRHHLSVGRVVHRPLPDGRVMKSCSEAGI